MTFLRRSEDEEIKDAGFTLDFDEIARRGSLTPEEKSIAKWYGIYGSRQPGNHMARVVIPGGEISSTQARNMAKVSEDFGQGILNITTRQAIQFHWLKATKLPDMIRALATEGSTTKHGCGDVTRNVAACPLAATCRYARFNVMPHTLRTAKVLSDAEDLENLPRKFKITFSGCPAACAQPYMNCVGNIAVSRKQGDLIEQGFEVVIGGGMGWKAFVAQKLFTFVPPQKITEVSRAIGLMFRDHGDRYNRAKSRLKFVVHRYGIDKCRELVLDYLKQEDVSLDGISWEPFTEAGKDIPDRPLSEETPVGTDGMATLQIMVPKGEMQFTQLKKLADLADLYGRQRLITTNRQNINIPGVDPAKVEEVKKEVHKIGFITQGFYGIRDIVPCVGTTYCPKAVARTRDLYDTLHKLVSHKKYDGIEKKVLINITGCPNSCSPYRIVDIGYRGMRIREELGSVEGYEMLIGGDQKEHGKKLGEFKVQDIPEITQKVLDHFIQVRHEDESLTQTVARLGIELFREVVYS